jgi:hypothetical protein
MYILMATFGIIGFFKSLGSDLSSGVTWLYSHTVGEAITFVTGGITTIVLTPIEIFFVDAITAVLSAFGSVLGYMESFVNDVVTTEITLAGSLSLFGPVIAIWILVAIFVVCIILIRVIIALY